MLMHVTDLSRKEVNSNEVHELLARNYQLMQKNNERIDKKIIMSTIFVTVALILSKFMHVANCAHT